MFAKLNNNSQNACGLNNNMLNKIFRAIYIVNIMLIEIINPFAPEPPVTARADPRPFYPL